MGSLIRRTFSVPVPAGAKTVTKNGKPHVRVSVRGRTVLFPLTADGTHYQKPTGKWYGQFRDADNVVRREPLSKDKAIAQQMLAKLEHKVDRQKSGLFDPAEDHAKRTLLDQLEDYGAVLQSKGDSADYVKRTKAYIEAVLRGCSFAFPADVDASDVAKFFNGLREDKQPVAVPAAVESFTVQGVAKLLGISTDAVADHVARHGLEATGKGRARRIARASGRPRSIITFVPFAVSSAGC